MEAWVEAAAERFWHAAGGPETFPRTLEGSIALALPVMVARLPRLGLFSAERWLSRRGAPADAAAPVDAARRDRPLRACLYAWDGSGCILLDAADPPDEQRFSLAHEAAHFILDYQQPRERVAARVGDAATAVLDGRRAATLEERIDATLAGVTLAPHLHLMERGERGIERGAVAAAESRADQLAFELLAPWRQALALLPDGGRAAERQAGATRALASAFGLPTALAEAYARRLLAARDGPPRWREWLA